MRFTTLVFTSVLLLSPLSGALAFDGIADKISYAKTLCDKAMSSSGSRTDCKNAYATKSYVQRANTLVIAITICRQGTGGGGSRGVQCYEAAARMLRFASEVRACDSGSYPRQFTCLDELFNRRHSASVPRTQDPKGRSDEKVDRGGTVN